MEKSRRHAGDGIVVYSRRMKVCAIILAVITLGIGVLLGIITPPAQRMPVAICFGIIALLPLALLLEVSIARITYDDRAIRTRSAWRFSRFIPFSAIKSCHYSVFARRYQIRTQHYGAIRLSIEMRGIPDLLKLLPCPHPGYPPADLVGESTGDLNSAVILPATLPFQPGAARMNAAKGFAIFFFVGGLGVAAWWPFYRLPERSHFVEIEGSLTEMTTQPMSKKNILLKIRMTNAPALLTWSSNSGKGALLRELLNETRIGDQITVLVSKAELEHPPHALLAAEPQIWLAGLRVGQKSYLTFANHLVWHQENRNFILLLALLLFGVSGVVLWDARRKQKRLNLSVSPISSGGA